MWSKVGREKYLTAIFIPVVLDTRTIGSWWTIDHLTTSLDISYRAPSCRYILPDEVLIRSQ